MIPAALFVIIIPLIGAILTYMLRRWHSLEVFVALLSCVAVIALLTRPATSALSFLGVTIDIGAPLNVIGRTLQVRTSERLPIVLMYSAAALIFALSWRAPQGWTFLPIGMAVLSALSAGLLIRPFVYAALAFEVAAALAVLMIQAERNGVGTTRGATRYLAVTTLALPMFLLSGWVISRAGSGNLADLETTAAAFGPAIVPLLAGFALLLGAVPLFTWAHPVAKDAPPLVTAFLGSAALSATVFLFLEFWQEYPWLRTSALVLNAMTVAGIVLLIFSGVVAWAQTTFARVMACAILVEVGCVLLPMSTSSQLAVESVAFDAVVRAISLGLFGLGIWRVRAATGGEDDFASARGLRDIWTALALGIGGLSLAGLPGTIGFVARWTAARAYSVTDTEGLVLILAVSASVGIGVVRGIAAVYSDPLPNETPPAIIGEQLALFASDARVNLPDNFELSTANARLDTSDMDGAGTGETDSDVDDTQAGDMEPGDAASDAEGAADAGQAIHLTAASARFVICLGAAVTLLLGLWPGIITPLVKAVAAQYTFYH